MTAWVCEKCLKVVSHPNDRYNISEDAMRADGTKRAYRIPLYRLCGDCMREREEMLRPSFDPNQGTLV